MEYLESFLSSLNDNSTFDHSPVLVNNISEICLFGEEKDGGSLRNHVAYLLFESSSPPNSIMFLECSYTNILDVQKKVKKAKVDLLKFCTSFLKKFTNSTMKYGISLVRRIFQSYRKEESNEVKTEMITFIKRIVQFLSSDDSSRIFGSLSDDELVAMIEQILLDLKFNKKASKGLRCVLLQYLGHLVDHGSISNIFSKFASDVIGFCLQLLAQNTSDSSSKEPELQIICGSLSCLDRWVKHYDNVFVEQIVHVRIENFSVDECK